MEELNNDPLLLQFSIPEDMSNEEVFNHFKQFGHLFQSSVIYRFGDHRESLSFGKIKYIRVQDAIEAFKNCDRKFCQFRSDLFETSMIQIPENGIGYSYYKIFGPYLGEK